MTQRLPFVLTLFFVCIATTPVEATRLVGRFDVESMTREAHVVVRARVVDQSARWDEKHERIHTRSTLRVLERIRGEQKLSKQLVVTQVGGTVGDITMYVDGTARLSPSEEVILFLRRSDKGSYALVGMANGKFAVQREKGRARVTREAFPSRDKDTGTSLAVLRTRVRSVR